MRSSDSLSASCLLSLFCNCNKRCIFLYHTHTHTDTDTDIDTDTDTHTHTHGDVAYSLKYTGDPNLKALTFKSITLFHSHKNNKKLWDRE